MKTLLKYLLKQFPDNNVQVAHLIDNFTGIGTRRDVYTAYISGIPIFKLSPTSKSYVHNVECDSLQLLKTTVKEQVLEYKERCKQELNPNTTDIDEQL